MALRAIDVAAVILGFVRQRRMTIVGRRPGIGFVAGITLQRGTEVIRVLSCCYDPVVTRRAASQYLRVVDGYDRRESIGGMAVLTHVRRLRVPRVLAGCIIAIVAAEAIARDIYVIEICRYPGHRTVAIVAVIATRNVVGCLAGRSDTIVT